MLVVIDPGVDDCDLLVSGVLPRAKVLVLDAQKDAIAQITHALRRTSGPFSSLHIVAPGAPGVLRFTSGELSLSTIGSYVEQLQTWFISDPAAPAAVSRVLEPKLLLYGCRIGAEQKGMEFVDTLTWITGAMVSAATTRVGRGMWHLSGQETAELAFTVEVQKAYGGVFA